MKKLINDSASSMSSNEDNLGRLEIDTILRQRKQQQTLNQAKDEFIAITSHQLRTPATCVKQYLGMLLEGFAGDVPEELLEFIQKAYDNNEKQLKTINNMLKIAELDAGRFILSTACQDACSLVQDVVERMTPVVHMRQQSISFTPPASCDLMVDATEIKTVIGSLIENASQFSPPGSLIQVKASLNKRFFKIMIIDSGVGLSKGDSTVIFKKFWRIPNELSDTVNSNGLGLYLARKIVRMHKGTLTVSSKPDKGSIFAIALPLLEVEQTGD